MPRYFLMRCADARVLEKAARGDIWPVSFGVRNRLNEAFASGEPVVLIFTVTLSGSFQGAARMLSPADEEASKAWGACIPACRIQWIRRQDLAYAEAEHLINPFSEPQQPVRAGKDGTEIEKSVAEELLSLLEKAAAIPKPSPKPEPGSGEAPTCDTTGGGIGGGMGPPAAAAAGTAAVAEATGAGAPVASVAGMGGGPMPGMMGPGMVSMPDPSSFFMGMSPLLAQQMALGMMHPMMAAAAGMLNPMAAAMMMGSMPGMMAGMRPPMMPSTNAPSAAKGDGGGSGAAAAKPEPAGVKAEPAGTERLWDGLPPGFGGGERDWYDLRHDGPRGGYRDGPPFRDGPPLYGFRDGPPPRDYDYDRFYDSGPPGRPGPYDRGLPPLRNFRGGPPPPRGREFEVPPPPARYHDDRPDLLRMSYEEYVDRFNQLKELQAGEGKPGASPMAATEGPVQGEGKETDGALLAIEGGGTHAADGGGGGPPNLALMGEDDYVAYCEKFSAQMGMPFDAALVRQHYRTATAAIAAQAQAGGEGRGGDAACGPPS